MLRHSILFLALAISVTNAACSKEGGSAPASSSQPAQTSAKAAAHAAKDVKPGSYEDWCEEHQVPESQCTQCNPSLAAAFKATGDWCEEHGVPESQCRKCHPDLKIARPPKPN